MKIILREDVANLGVVGTTVTVSDGFARNYLLPRKLAVQAESGSARQIEHELQIIRRREDKRRTVMVELGKQLEALTVEVSVRVGEEEKVFGSITTAHIAEKLHEMGYEIDKRNILLDEPIKELGVFSVRVGLGKELHANLKLWVSKEESG